jgi:hypothetical protein
MRKIAQLHICQEIPGRLQNRLKFCYNPTGHVSARVPSPAPFTAFRRPHLGEYLMKLFRVGSCLALLVAGVACTQTPNAPTAPSAAAGTSTAAAADGTLLKVTAPAPVAPANGDRADDRHPTLVWLNANGLYGTIGVAYDIQLSTPAEVVYERTVGESPDRGAHLVELELAYDTVYSWRVRAHVGNPDMYGPWSEWVSFLSPTKPVAVTPVVPTGSGTSCTAAFSAPGTRISSRPNDSDIPRALASQYGAALRHSCQPEGGSWEFMDRTVDALRARNGRYGYNAKRGNMNDPSLDVVSFYRGADANNFQGSTDVYIFDLIGGHCGSNPSIIWNDVTDITYSSGTVGRTMYPRPGRNVTSSPCTTAGTSDGPK